MSKLLFVLLALIPQRQGTGITDIVDNRLKYRAEFQVKQIPLQLDYLASAKLAENGAIDLTFEKWPLVISVIRFENLTDKMAFQFQYGHDPKYKAEDLKLLQVQFYRIDQLFPDIKLKSASEPREFKVKVVTTDGKVTETKPFRILLKQ